MKFRNPEDDALANVWGLKLFLAAIPVFLIILVVRGDAPAWAYFGLVGLGVLVGLFLFVLLPPLQDWGKRRRQRLFGEK